MKTYYDITIVTKLGDRVNINKLSYSHITQLTSNDDIETIIINKEYSKKIK